MRVRYFLVNILILLAFQTYSQSEEKVDSLLVIAKGDDLKAAVDAYNALSDLYWHSSPTTAIAYADKAYNKVKNIDYAKGLIRALENKGISAYTIGKYDSAASFYRRAIEKSYAAGLESNAHLLYINLLKKQGDFNQIISTVNLIMPDSSSQVRVNPQIKTALADAFAELGNVSLASKYLNMILDHPLYQKDSVRKADLNFVLAKYLNLINDYDSASSVLNQSIEIYQSYDDVLGIARAKLQLGSTRLILGETKEAQQLFLEAFNKYDSADYPFGVAEAKRYLGSFYSTLSEFGKASEFLFEALEIYEEQNNLNEIAKIYNELAWIHKSQRMVEKATQYVEKAIEISDRIGNKNVEGTAWNIYGVILDSQDRHSDAIEKFEKALDLKSSIGDNKGVAAILYNIAFIKEAEGQYDEAETMYLEAYEIEKEIGNVLGAAISEYTLGSLYTNTNQLQLAERYLDKSRITLRRLESKENLLYNYLYSARLFEKKGDIREANSYFKAYIALKDSLTDEQIRSQITELEIKYDLKNKEREIEFLNLENKSRDQELVLKEQVIQNQRLFIGFAVIGGGLLLVLLFVGYRLLKVRNKANEELKALNREIQEKNEEITAQSEELQEANTQISIMNQSLEGKVGERTKELKRAYKELDTFFYRSSHDFRRPLTTFLGLAEVAKSTLTDKYSLDLFSKVETTALQLDKMVHKLKAVSLISDESLSKEKFEMSNLINSSLNKWRTSIEKNGFEIEKHIEVNTILHYRDLLEIIFDNLIENSIQYNDSTDPKITIAVKQKGEELLLSVKDNGVGIPSEFHNEIFDMYFRANETSMGNGLGLYLVRKTVDRLKGKIRLKSEPYFGTSISISIPAE